MPADIASSEPAAPDARKAGPGELLRSCRKDRGLSVEQVAEDLHLGEHVVAALEAEQFAEIGAPVFVRGHLKAYARALRMDEGAIIEAYRAAQPEEPVEPLLTRRAPERHLNISPMPVILGAVGAVLAIAMAWYLLRDVSTEEVSVEASPSAGPPPATDLLTPAEPVTAAQAPSAASLVPAATPGEDQAPEPVAAVVDLVPAEAAVPAALSPPGPEVVSEAPAPADGIQLELYFREESWVEISDAEGRVLFGLQREGMRRQLTGEPPIQILLGNAPGVDVYLDKKPYPVPARNVNGKVARFAIDAAPESGR